MTSTEAVRRPYNSTRRARQAAQTRQDVVDAAVQLFSTAGWTGATLSALAVKAGVAVETVYAGFGSKKHVLRAVLDGLPVVTPELPAGRRTTRDERLATAVAAVAELHNRWAGVWRALLEAASGDGEVEGWRVQLERERRIDVGRSLGQVFGTELDSGVLDLLWAALGPEVHRKLVHDAGWSRGDYEDHLCDAVARVVGPVRRRR